jgi:hypothetical protein
VVITLRSWLRTRLRRSSRESPVWRCGRPQLNQGMYLLLTLIPHCVLDSRRNDDHLVAWLMGTLDARNV